MRKRRRIRRIIIASVLVVILAFIGTTVYLAMNKKDYGVNITNPANIRIYSNASENFYEYNYKPDTDEYKNIMSQFENSFKVSLLNLLWNQKTKASSYIDDTNAKSSIKDIIGENSNYFYLEFEYNGPQTLMINDEPYYKSDGKTAVEYSTLLVEVKPSTKVEDVKIYVETKTQYSISSQYQICTIADYGYLYTYINGLLNK